MPQKSGQTLADRIFAALAQRITGAGLAPGARLRQEEIAAEFGASQGPVREAFRLLEAAGLVLSQPRRGVRVASFDRTALIEAVEMRAVLEGLALRHATPLLGAADLAALTAADAACSTATTVADWEETNRSFHRLLIARCPMPRLMQTIERTRALVARQPSARTRSPALPHNDRDHKAILAALASRDADKAGDLLTRHIRRGTGLA